MLLTTESFKTTLGSTTRLRDIFMHVVLIKNTVGHAARRVLDVTKKKISGPVRGAVPLLTTTSTNYNSLQILL